MPAQAPRLPCEAKVDVTKCHACHAKYRCRQVPRLPQRWLYSHPHPCLSGYWYCHVFVNPQGERNPRVVAAAVRWLSLRRPVKSRVQVAAAVVTCLVGIPCSSAYTTVLAGLPPCLTPLAALAAPPRQSLLHWLACRHVWAVSQNKSLLQRCECSIQKPQNTPKMAQRGPECPNIAHNAQHKPEIRQT